MKWRVVLSAEDGRYILADGFLTREEAEQYLEGKRWLYGEGQNLIVESYKEDY